MASCAGGTPYHGPTLRGCVVVLFWIINMSQAWTPPLFDKQICRHSLIGSLFHVEDITLRVNAGFSPPRIVGPSGGTAIG